MTPLAHKVIQDVAAEWGINAELLTAKCRRPRIVWARVDVVKRLHAQGYTTYMIGKQLSCDHSTVLYYLGRYTKKKPTTPKWSAPTVRHLRWIKVGKKPREPEKITRYLIPYAGADFTEYRWKERPSHFGGVSNERQARDGAASRQPASGCVARAELRADHDQAATA